MRVRFAAESDWIRIIDIYNQATEDGFCNADTEPVTVEERREWLSHHDRKYYPLFAVEDSNVITGWCSLSPYRPGKRALRKVAEISYYVDRKHRGEGTGDLLISHAGNYARGVGHTHLFAILLDINHASVSLLEKHGFEKWGHLPEIADFGETTCGQFIFGKKL